MNNDEIIEKIKKEALENHVPILQDPTMELIEAILTIAKPSRILEVGTAVGYSAIMFSKYLSGENSKITTFEIKEEMFKKAKENILLMGSKVEDKIDVILADATEYLNTMKNDNYFDVIFIDAAKGKYMVFLEEAIRLVKPGGIILADNVLFKGRVLGDYNEHKYRTAVTRLREFISFIQTDKRLFSRIIDIGDGLSISIVNK